MTFKIPLRASAILLSSFFLTACYGDNEIRETKAGPGFETGADGQGNKNGAESDLKSKGDSANLGRSNLPTYLKSIAKITQVSGTEIPCAGALVAPTKVLTAADCIRQPQPVTGASAVEALFQSKIENGFDNLSKVAGTNLIRWESRVESDKVIVMRAALAAAVFAAEKSWAAYLEASTYEGVSVEFPLSDAFLGNVYTAVSVDFHDGYWAQVDTHFKTCVSKLSIARKATYSEALKTFSAAPKALADCLDEENVQNNMAVLTLAEPVEGITPLEIATPRMAKTYLLNEATVILAGFSNRESTGEAINAIPSTPVEFPLDCGTIGCIGNPIWVKGNPGASCDGDTGGPFLIVTKEGPLVVGVASPHAPGKDFVKQGQASCSTVSSFARIDRAAAWYRQE